ncbi:Hypothetical protein AKI40_2399 [Enterobacter sp. FY-07]|nr:Hypothetical protein AKI40_2399 [Enterobacter sp. FY-07]
MHTSLLHRKYAALQLQCLESDYAVAAQAGKFLQRYILRIKHYELGPEKFRLAQNKKAP